MGINVGDIIIEDGDIFGDGVNIAARLEALAEPGGICVSAAAHEQVRDRLDIGFDDMGEQQVKNITRPVRVYSIGSRSPGAHIIDTQVVSVSSALAALPLLEKPSIAVLPFANMSSDPDQEYFSDGITEDLITALSRLRWFFVIARNSTFVYKGQAVDVKQVGRDLGVRYVLEGSVRKGGQRVRITSQLIDAITGNHIWAERYDRELTDIFALQDEITASVTTAIEPKLLAAEAMRAESRSGENLNAWDSVARALSQFWKLTATDSEQPLPLCVRLLSFIRTTLPPIACWHSRCSFRPMSDGRLSPAIENLLLTSRSVRWSWTRAIPGLTWRSVISPSWQDVPKKPSVAFEPRSISIRISLRRMDMSGGH
jgi:adenylate cyclase